MPRTLRATDLFELRAIGSVAVGDDLIAYTVTWNDEPTDEPRSTIHLLQGDHRHQLTNGHRDTAPTISPDGTRIAFLRCEAKGKPQAAIVSIDSGNVETITGYANERVEQAAWIDNQRLLVRATRRPTELAEADDDELARRPLVTKRLDFRYNGRGTTVYANRRVDIVELDDAGHNTTAVHSLTQLDVDHEAAAASPDGRTVVVVAPTDTDADITGRNHVWSLPIGGGEAQQLTTEPGRWNGVGFTADGRPFAIGDIDPKQPGLARPHILAGDEDPSVLGPHDINASAAIGGSAGARVVDGALYLPGIRGTTISVDRYDDTTGELTTVAGGSLVVTSFDVSSDDAIIAAVSTPTRPAELWRFGPDGHEVLVSLNDELLAELDLAEPELVHVRSTDGVDVEALLVRPPAAANASNPGPGLIYIHGGPMGAYTQSFFDEFQMAAADGYTVIAGNPRGSDGYGEAWMRAITGDLGNRDWADVQALTDHLAALETVDADRIGIGGGSYGGFMTSWAIGHTHRYRAALVERAVTNWETMAGTSDIGSWFLDMLLEASWEHDLDRLRALSPMQHAGNISTPTLILHSEEDWRCPIEQAEQLFAVLRRNKVDVTLARFPGENHELSRGGSPHHRVERLRLVHDFYATHLLDRPSQI